MAIFDWFSRQITADSAGESIFTGVYSHTIGSPPNETTETKRFFNLIGAEGNDILTGGDPVNIENYEFNYDGADILGGGGGDDILNGSGGNDILGGSDGADILNGGANDDRLEGGVGADTLNGDGGNDALYAGAGDTTHGGAGDDTINSDGGDTLIDGGADFDILNVAPTSGYNDFSGTTITGMEELRSGASTHLKMTAAQLNGFTSVVFSGDNVGERAAEVVLTTGGTVGLNFAVASFGRITASDAVTVIDVSGTSGNWFLISGDAGVDGNVLTGGSGNDNLTSEEGDDTLNGSGGNDILGGSDGADILNGGANDDRLEGGVGADTLNGDGGNDALYAGAGDTTHGGAGDDTINSDGGDALIDGGEDFDTLKVTPTSGYNDFSGTTITGVEELRSLASTHLKMTAAQLNGFASVVLSGDIGAEVRLTSGGTVGLNFTVASFGRITASDAVTVIDVSGTSGNWFLISGDAGVDGNVLTGGSGNDNLTSEEGDDTLNGSGGNDILGGSDGADILNGGANDDRLEGGVGADMLNGGLGADTLDGGGDIDTADYSDKTASLYVALNGASNSSVLVGGVVEDAVRNIENATGGSASDSMTGDGLANLLAGGGGNDTLRGGGGNDVIDGGIGASDAADYRDKTAALYVALNGASNSVMKVGGIDEDTIRNAENVYGGSGNDSMTGDGLANLLLGGGGNDTLRGGGGNDVIDGGAGAGDAADYRDKTAALYVALNGASNSVMKVGGIDEDTIRNAENVYGGSGNDSMTGDGLANLLLGGGGNDTLRGGGGNDVIDGGAGAGDAADFRDKTTVVSVTLNGVVNAMVNVGGLSEDTVRNVEKVYGGSVGDILIGDGFANLFLGGGGDDRLAGMLGNDVLDGGLGADKFVFNTALGAANVDTIVNYNVTDDTIELENAIFAGLVASAPLGGAFNIGAAATQEDDRIIYNNATGALFFDIDGVGGTAHTQFATLAAGLALTGADFVVV